MMEIASRKCFRDGLALQELGQALVPFQRVAVAEGVVYRSKSVRRETIGLW